MISPSLLWTAPLAMVSLRSRAWPLRESTSHLETYGAYSWGASATRAMPVQRSFAVSLGSQDGGLAGVVKEMLYSKEGVEVAMVLLLSLKICLPSWGCYIIINGDPIHGMPQFSVADFIPPAGYEAIHRGPFQRQGSHLPTGERLLASLLLFVTDLWRWCLTILESWQ